MTSRKVLITGGEVAGAADASTELYNPTTNQWSPAGTMTSTRAYHAAATLALHDLLGEDPAEA
jgi:hypothetical protein